MFLFLKTANRFFVCLFRIHHKKRLPHKRTIFRNYVSLLAGRNISKAYTFTQYTWNQGLLYVRHSAGVWMPECVVNLKTRSQVQVAKNFWGEGSKNYILEYTDLGRNPWCANYRRWNQSFHGRKERKIWYVVLLRVHWYWKAELDLHFIDWSGLWSVGQSSLLSAFSNRSFLVFLIYANVGGLAQLKV